jgi:hypothetical protein
VSSVSFVSTTNTARSLAGCVSLALALTPWRSPGRALAKLAVPRRHSVPRHRVEKVRNLDMVVEALAGEAPFRVFIELVGLSQSGGTLFGLAWSSTRPARFLLLARARVRYRISKFRFCFGHNVPGTLAELR